MLVFGNVGSSCNSYEREWEDVPDMHRAWDLRELQGAPMTRKNASQKDAASNAK
jgi:hypothetical protein